LNKGQELILFCLTLLCFPIAIVDKWDMFLELSDTHWLFLWGTYSVRGRAFFLLPYSRIGGGYAFAELTSLILVLLWIGVTIVAYIILQKENDRTLVRDISIFMLLLVGQVIAPLILFPWAVAGTGFGISWVIPIPGPSLLAIYLRFLHSVDGKYTGRKRELIPLILLLFCMPIAIMRTRLVYPESFDESWLFLWGIYRSQSGSFTFIPYSTTFWYNFSRMTYWYLVLSWIGITIISCLILYRRKEETYVRDKKTFIPLLIAQTAIPLIVLPLALQRSSFEVVWIIPIPIQVLFAIILRVFQRKRTRSERQQGSLLISPTKNS
jgi:hypothetical protein